MRPIPLAIVCCTLGFVCAMMDGVYLHGLGGALLCGAILLSAALVGVANRFAARPAGDKLGQRLPDAVPYCMLAAACTLLPFLFTGSSPLSALHPLLHAILLLLLCAAFAIALREKMVQWERDPDAVDLSKMPKLVALFALAALAGWTLGVRAFTFAKPDSVALHATTAILIAALASCALFLAGRHASNGQSGQPTDAEAHASEDNVMVEICRALSREANLSRREEEVLALLAEGNDTRDIEKALTVSRNTVKTHLRNVYAKLEVHSRDELLQRLVQESETVDAR